MSKTINNYEDFLALSYEERFAIVYNNLEAFKVALNIYKIVNVTEDFGEEIIKICKKVHLLNVVDILLEYYSKNQVYDIVNNLIDRCNKTIEESLLLNCDRYKDCLLIDLLNYLDEKLIFVDKSYMNTVVEEYFNKIYEG